MRSFKSIQASGYITDNEMAEYGIRKAELPVLRMLDTNTHLRWFYRQHEELGTLTTLVGDDNAPLNPEEVLRTAKEAFGECVVLW